MANIKVREAGYATEALLKRDGARPMAYLRETPGGTLAFVRPFGSLKRSIYTGRRSAPQCAFPSLPQRLPATGKESGCASARPGAENTLQSRILRFADQNSKVPQRER
jgi:hypothetical protein